MKVCIAQNVSLSDHLALSTYLRSISKYLAKQEDIELTLLTLKGSRIPKDLSQSVDIHEINGDLYSIKGNMKYAFGLYKKLKEIDKKEKIDIIHCLYPNSSVLGAALFKRTSPKTKIIYDIRSPWIEMSIEKGSIPKSVVLAYRRIAYLGENFLTHYVDGFIFITEGLKKFYEKKIKLDSKPVDIIPSGVDLNLFSKRDPSIIRDKYNLKEDDFLIGYVGGISKMRELDFILKAFKELNKTNKNYKLMFVGDGDDKKHLETLVKELQVENNVIFTGRVLYEEVPYYMSAFNVGLCHLPDKLVFRYSFPMKVLEYLACGTPVLASDIEAHREIAKKINNIYLYNSIISFINKFEDVCYEKNNNIEKYNWKNICKEIEKVWKNVYNDVRIKC